MPSDTKTRTILLADLVGSSTQMSRLDTEQGADFILDATQPIQAAIRDHDGQVIKFTGDGYFGTFESANDALEAADEIRNHFLRQRYTPNGIALDGVRLVVHTADIMVTDNDIVGDGVIVVARLEKNVPTNSVWVTAATREVCSNTNLLFESVGEVRIRGRARAIEVYALQSSETSYIEEDIVLLVTDLHRYIEIGETLSPSDLNDWLLKWGNLHREAVQGLKGRVRQFVADMALLTFTHVDDAIQCLLNLQALSDIHNRNNTSLPPYSFKSAIAHGNLILSPTGIVGPLVNQTFEVLNKTPRTSLGIHPDACTDIAEVYRQRCELIADAGIYLFKQEINMPQQ